MQTTDVAASGSTATDLLSSLNRRAILADTSEGTTTSPIRFSSMSWGSLALTVTDLCYHYQ